MFIDPINYSLAFLPVQSSRNKIEYVIDPADTAITDRAGLRYYLELLVPEFAGSSVFKRLVKMPGSEKPPATAAGSSVFEGCFYQLDELLDGFLEAQKPSAKAVDMCIISTLTMPYMVKESVTNNGQALVASNKDIATRWILKAGLLERDFAAWGNDFFTDYMSANRQFLTWQPNGKTVSRYQEEYLFFLLNIQPVPASLIRRVRVTYSDGQQETLDKGTLSGGQAFGVVCMPVGPQALALPSNVVEYEVWLSDGNRNRISEVRSYRIDKRHRNQQRFILFSNSLGGWDTLRLTGEGSETLTTQRATAELERPAGAPADFAELRVIYLQGSRSLTVSTGYFEGRATEYVRYLDELLLSKEVYLVDERGHQALELQTNSMVDREDNTDLQSKTFAFRFVTPQFNFSSMPAAPATPARPTGWRGVGVVYVQDENGKRTGKGRPLKLQKYYLDDSSLYKPVTEKPNQPGDPDYVESLPLPGIVVGSTPYPSAGLTRATTYKRSTCTGGQIGDVATIVIAGGKYGSEISQADADSKAEAEYKQLNTQAYADQYGTCTAAPELYQIDVPAGQWHYRVNDGNKFETEWLQDGSGEPKIGNTWDLQGQNRTFVFPRFSNDLNFPVKPSDWRFFLYGTANSQVNLKLYQNGALRVDRAITINKDGYEYLSLSGELASSGHPLMAGDKLYFKATQL